MSDIFGVPSNNLLLIFEGNSVTKLHLLTIAALLSLTACETTKTKMGSLEAKTVATGAAGGAISTNANTALEKCASPLGTVSLVENVNAGWYTILRDPYRLPPTANLLRLMIQQSNCFVVVERSAASTAAMNRERDLMASGQARAGSNIGQSQMVISDYGLSPEVIFNNQNAGGMGGALGSLIEGGAGRALAGVAGSLNTKEASTMLTLVDNRSGVQVSASEGSASKTDFGVMGGLFGGSAGGSVGAYSNTAQGKVISAAFMDAYNQMVTSLRNYKAQTVTGQGLGGGGKLGVDGASAPAQTFAPADANKKPPVPKRPPAAKPAPVRPVQ